jgi:hypothetical protein
MTEHGSGRPRRVAAILLLVLAALATDPLPVQPQVSVAPPPATPVAENLQSEGRVTRVDRQARTITLDTGTEYVLPPILEAAWTVVADGSEVRLRYNVDGGRNVVTHLQVVR